MTSRPGRPRSEESRQRILQGVRELLSDSDVGAISMDAIAARARVSKQTLYRWWPSKSAIIADAVLDGYEPPVPATVVLSKDRRADVDGWIDRSIAALSDPETATAIRTLLGAVAVDQDAGRRFYDGTLGPARLAVSQLAGSGGRGEAHADVALSALLFWVLVGAEMDDAHREALRALLTESPAS
jgi:AcrR family transcriptional regulator